MKTTSENQKPLPAGVVVRAHGSPVTLSVWLGNRELIAALSMEQAAAVGAALQARQGTYMLTADVQQVVV